MKVRVREEGIKLNGVWRYKGEEAIIDEEQYEKNKDFLDIIEDEEGPKLPQVPRKEDEENEKKLQELRAKAKKLGVRNAHLMGKEKLEATIAEKEAPLFGTKKEENSKVDDINVGDIENKSQE